MAPGGGLGIDFSPHPRPKLYQRSASESPKRREMRPQAEGAHYGLSSKAMAGLHLAEVGASMVEMHKMGNRANFKEGKHIDPGSLTPIERSTAGGISCRGRPPFRRGTSVDEGLPRHGTLLNLNVSPTRRSKELKALLGNGSSKVKSGAIVADQQGKISKKSTDAVAYEQGRSKQRVAIDMDLVNNVVVEGGFISGIINLRVRPRKNDSVLHLGSGKLRIAGFEVAPGNETQHIFYQHSAPLLEVTNGCKRLFMSNMDKDGFGSVIEGDYALDFSMKIPQGTAGRPRGILRSKSGVNIRYIVIASIKVVETSTGKRSIAHFYRDCEIWPACSPMQTLAPAPEPITAEAAKNVFMGGDGTVVLKASLFRLTWIANNSLYVTVHIANDTRKAVRGVILELIQTTTTFKPSMTALSSTRDTIEGAADVEADMTNTKERKVGESVLMASGKGAKGHASAKGYWTGVESGKTSSVVHSMHIPHNALTIPRARLVEVDYAVRVSLCVASLTGVAEAVHVLLPVRIVNFLSLDAPPSDSLPPAPRQPVIELNTPKPNVAGIGGPRSHKRTRPHRTLDEVAQTTYNLQTAYHRSQEAYSSHSSHVSDLSSASSLSSGPQCQPRSSPEFDLGTVEDPDDLNYMLGDIPGSTSILEETDIDALGAASGYSSESSFYNHQDQRIGEETDEDMALERMLVFASARASDRVNDTSYSMASETISQQLSQSSVSYASDVSSRPSMDGSRLRGPRSMTQRPKMQRPGWDEPSAIDHDFVHESHRQHTQHPQEAEDSFLVSAKSQGAWAPAPRTSISRQAHQSRAADPWLDSSESEYSPSAVTPSSASTEDEAYSAGVTTGTSSDPEATPIPGSAQAFSASPMQARRWMRTHANGCASARASPGFDGGGRMKLSNVQARVAKYERRYRENPTHAIGGCLMP